MCEREWVWLSAADWDALASVIECAEVGIAEFQGVWSPETIDESERSVARLKAILAKRMARYREEQI